MNIVAAVTLTNNVNYNIRLLSQNMNNTFEIIFYFRDNLVFRDLSLNLSAIS